MPKHQQNAKKLRLRAAECRVLAGVATTPEGKESYLKLADAYDAIAMQEEAMAPVPPDRR